MTGCPLIVRPLTSSIGCYIKTVQKTSNNLKQGKQQVKIIKVYIIAKYKYLFLKVIYCHIILLTLSITELCEDKVDNILVNLHSFLGAHSYRLDACGLVPLYLSRVPPWDTVHLHVTCSLLCIGVSPASCGNQVKGVEKTSNNLVEIVCMMAKSYNLPVCGSFQLLHYSFDNLHS